MPVVSIDERGRMTFPKKTGVRGERAVLISVGSYYTVIPIPEEPEKYAEGWLGTEKSRKELKKLAEEAAKKDAEKRAQRRDQL